MNFNKKKQIIIYLNSCHFESNVAADILPMSMNFNFKITMKYKFIFCFFAERISSLFRYMEFYEYLLSSVLFGNFYSLSSSSSSSSSCLRFDSHSYSIFTAYLFSISLPNSNFQISL